MNATRMWMAGWAALSLILAGCDDGPSDKGCPCLSEQTSLVADSLGGILAGLIKSGSANGFPGEFTRSCDSIRYTFYAWFSIPDPARQDSQLTLNTLPVSVRIDRDGGNLIYAARLGDSVLAMDTVKQWWAAFGAGDSSTCLPNVENVIVDSIDGRLLASLDFPDWKLQPKLEGAQASCDTLTAKLTLADPSHPRSLAFDLMAKAKGDSLTATATLSGQSFLVLRASAWCRTLGVH